MNIEHLIERIEKSDGLSKTLGMHFISTPEPDTLQASMKVDGRNKQPFGFLSGGASLALAENLAGVSRKDSRGHQRERYPRARRFGRRHRDRLWQTRTQGKNLAYLASEYQELQWRLDLHRAGHQLRLHTQEGQHRQEGEPGRGRGQTIRQGG